jgi:hypothetical protein
MARLSSVVLIVKDELLLRMDSAELIANVDRHGLTGPLEFLGTAAQHGDDGAIVARRR